MCAFFLQINGFSQNYPSFDQLEETISDSSSSTFYPKLIKRFQNFDTTLTSNDYVLIYYGYGFQKGYSGYRDDPTTKYFSLLNENKFEEVLALCDSTLKETPVCIPSNLYMGKMLKQQNPNSDIAQKYIDRAHKLMEVLFQSGDGKSFATAYKTLFLSDEKRVMYGLLELGHYSSQALVEHYDVLTVKKSKKFKQKQIYFDVFLPLYAMRRGFKSTSKTD